MGDVGSPGALPGASEVANEYGTCLVLWKELQCVAAMEAQSPDLILKNLQLVYGIGPKTESRLRTEGYSTVVDLLVHEKWGGRARPVAQAYEEADASVLSQCGARDVELLSMYAPDEIAFMDIETTGLAATYALFMVGMLLPSHGGLALCQVIAREYEEEPAVLEEVRFRLARARAVVTYNGKSFDVPFVRRRLAYHGMDVKVDFAVIDLLCHARRKYVGTIPNCRLTTVERCVLGLDRGQDVPGELIPAMYNEFVRTRNWDILIPILDHNEFDLIALARLLPLLV
ncbi:MAG: ribonuclease H-like domain-containing protein [Firmicutes bacterium]|jgi:uncharacterized protein YprB with RNaseH-like and TPR domain|nr:ribonuclease H-like domain-containing protein [Bacillota bacterium]